MSAATDYADRRSLLGEEKCWEDRLENESARACARLIGGDIHHERAAPQVCRLKPQFRAVDFSTINFGVADGSSGSDRCQVLRSQPWVFSSRADVEYVQRFSCQRRQSQTAPENLPASFPVTSVNGHPTHRSSPLSAWKQTNENLDPKPDIGREQTFALVREGRK
jgi:hypothetical protein